MSFSLAAYLALVVIRINYTVACKLFIFVSSVVLVYCFDLDFFVSLLSWGIETLKKVGKHNVRCKMKVVN